MTLDYAQVSNVANRIFQEPMRDYLNRSNPVLRAINKKAVASDRIYIKGISASEHGAGPIADGTDVIFAGNETTSYINPTLDWSTYIGKFRVNKRALEQMASQPGGLGNLLRSEIMNATKDLGDRLAADLMAGSVANGLVGMQAIIADDNTYAGIDRTLPANSEFRATVLDVQAAGPVTTELSTKMLYDLDQAFFDRVGYGFTERPGMFTGVTSSAIMTKYKLLMENIDLASLSTAHFVNQANDTGRLGIGSTGFAGVPFMRDRNLDSTGDLADSSRLYVLDMDYIDLCVLEPNSELSLVHQLQGYTAASTTDGIRVSIEFLGNSGETVQGYVKAYVQLASPDPKRAGMVIKNITAI